MVRSLTQLGVDNLKDEGYRRDTGPGSARGLYVQVAYRQKGGKLEKKHGVTRSWIYRFTSPVTGAVRWMGLGSCDAIGLAEARELARAARRLVTLGTDPIEYRKATVTSERDATLKAIASRMTFADCAERYLATVLKGFKNAP